MDENRAYTQLPDVLWLMAHSWRHHEYTVDDIFRVIAPPLALGQSVLIPRSTFISYGFLSVEAEAAFLSGSRKIQIADWSSGERCWVFDVINFGGRKTLLKAFRELKRRHPGISVRWRRSYHTGSRRFGELHVR